MAVGNICCVGCQPAFATRDQVQRPGWIQQPAGPGFGVFAFTGFPTGGVVLEFGAGRIDIEEIAVETCRPRHRGDPPLCVGFDQPGVDIDAPATEAAYLVALAVAITGCRQFIAHLCRGPGRPQVRRVRAAIAVVDGHQITRGLRRFHRFGMPHGVTPVIRAEPGLGQAGLLQRGHGVERQTAAPAARRHQPRAEGFDQLLADRMAPGDAGRRIVVARQRLDRYRRQRMLQRAVQCPGHLDPAEGRHAGVPRLGLQQRRDKTFPRLRIEGFPQPRGQMPGIGPARGKELEERRPVGDISGFQGAGAPQVDMRGAAQPGDLGLALDFPFQRNEAVVLQQPLAIETRTVQRIPWTDRHADGIRRPLGQPVELMAESGQRPFILLDHAEAGIERGLHQPGHRMIRAQFGPERHRQPPVQRIGFIAPYQPVQPLPVVARNIAAFAERYGMGLDGLCFHGSGPIQPARLLGPYRQAQGVLLDPDLDLEPLAAVANTPAPARQVAGPGGFGECRGTEGRDFAIVPEQGRFQGGRVDVEHPAAVGQRNQRLPERRQADQPQDKHQGQPLKSINTGYGAHGVMGVSRAIFECSGH